MGLDREGQISGVRGGERRGGGRREREREGGRSREGREKGVVKVAYNTMRCAHQSRDRRGMEIESEERKRRKLRLESER